LDLLIIWIALAAGFVLTGICWLFEAVKYWRNPRKRKEVKFAKFIVLMVLSFTIAGNILVIYEIAVFALLTEDLDDVIRIPVILGALISISFTGYSLIKATKVKW